MEAIPSVFPSHGFIGVFEFLAGGTMTKHPRYQCRFTHDGDSLGISNGRLSITFDSETGALASLFNHERPDQYLKEPGGEGNLFQCILDRIPEPVDPARCSLSKSSFKRVMNGGVLTLALRSASGDLSFDLRVLARDGDNAVDCTFSVRNESSRRLSMTTSFPHLTGLQLGTTRDTNLGVSTSGFGCPGEPAWTDTGELPYGGWECSTQWQAIYDLPCNQTFGVIVMDPDVRSKSMRRFPPSGMSVRYIPSTVLEPGESHRYPAARFVIAEGNWRTVANRYREWFYKTFKPRKSPQWLRQVDMYVGPWIPSAAEVEKVKALPEDLGEVREVVPGLTYSQGAFTSFRDIPRLYLCEQYDLKEWGQYNQGVVDHRDSYGPYMSDGTYYFRRDLGGAAAMREGVERLHGIGRRAIFYIAGFGLRKDSDLYRQSNMHDWVIMDSSGNVQERGYVQGVAMCPGSKLWQDHLAHTAKRILQESGADGIRLDEFGAFIECHNPAHNHKTPYDYNQWMRELLRRVRTAMDEVNPEAILLTEQPTDYFLEYCDGALRSGGAPLHDILAMRIALPDYSCFSYDPGAVQSSLNGAILGTPLLYHDQERWVEPSGTSSIPFYRWHELRATFVNAFLDGDISLIDPVAGGDPDMAIRLWKSKNYWLLVAGHTDGSTPENPTAIRLPELPKEIQSAYEIDARTLEIREAPLERGRNGIQVTVSSGSSAVLLPKLGCPSLVLAKGIPQTMKLGSAHEVELIAYALWIKGQVSARATVCVPGLSVAPDHLCVPGRIRLTVPSHAENGYYPLYVSGECLPLKRWLHVGLEGGNE